MGWFLVEWRKEVGWVDISLFGFKGGSIFLIFGVMDFVVLKEELIYDVMVVLGEDGFEVVVLNSGYELVMINVIEVVNIVVGFWLWLFGIE